LTLNAKGGIGRYNPDETYIPTLRGSFDLPETVGTLSDAAHNGGGLTGKTPTQAGSSPVAHCLASHYTKGGDPTTDNYIVTGGSFDVAHSLRADGFDASEDGTGRGTPIVPTVAPCLTRNYGKQPDSSDTNAGPMLVPIAWNESLTALHDQSPALERGGDGGPHSGVMCFSAKDHGADAMDDCSPTLRAGGHTGSHANAGVMPAVAIPILEAGARTGKSTDDIRAGSGIGEADDPMYTLQSGKQHAVAFAENQRGEIRTSDVSPQLSCAGGKPGSGYPAVAFESRFVRNGRGAPSEVVPPLKAQSGETGKGDAAPLVAFHTSGYGGQVDENCAQPLQASDARLSNQVAGVITPTMAVRRLTPKECARLQGFPDEFLDIIFRGKPASDGVKYKALGNSMAVPVLVWIGKRIMAVEGIG